MPFNKQERVFFKSTIKLKTNVLLVITIYNMSRHITRK